MNVISVYFPNQFQSQEENKNPFSKTNSFRQRKQLKDFILTKKKSENQLVQKQKQETFQQKRYMAETTKPTERSFFINNIKSHSQQKKNKQQLASRFTVLRKITNSDDSMNQTNMLKFMLQLKHHEKLNQIKDQEQSNNYTYFNITKLPSDWKDNIYPKKINIKKYPLKKGLDKCKTEQSLLRTNLQIQKEQEIKPQNSKIDKFDKFEIDNEKEDDSFNQYVQDEKLVY